MKDKMNQRTRSQKSLTCAVVLVMAIVAIVGCESFQPNIDNPDHESEQTDSDPLEELEIRSERRAKARAKRQAKEREEQARQYKEWERQAVKTMDYQTRKEASPNVEAKYTHDGKSLESVKTLFNQYETDGGHPLFVSIFEGTGPMPIGLFSERLYCDKEYLKAGTYQYVGPEVFDSADKTRQIVIRMFADSTITNGINAVGTRASTRDDEP